MKKGWEYKTLDEICSIVGRTGESDTYQRNHGDAIRYVLV